MTASDSSPRATAPIAAVPVKMAGDDPSTVEAERISGEIAIDRETVRRATRAAPPPDAPLADTKDLPVAPVTKNEP